MDLLPPGTVPVLTLIGTYQRWTVRRPGVISTFTGTGWPTIRQFHLMISSMVSVQGFNGDSRQG